MSIRPMASVLLSLRVSLRISSSLPRSMVISSFRIDKGSWRRGPSLKLITLLLRVGFLRNDMCKPAAGTFILSSTAREKRTT
jgi:hypothetical protein